LFTTAILFAQELVVHPDGGDEDRLLLARCFFQNGEHRRCLASLEQSQFLSAAFIKSIFERIRFSTGSAEFIPQESSSLRLGIDALLLASQSLFATEQLEDCLTLLESFILTDDEDSAIDAVVSNSRQLYVQLPAEINPLSGEPVLTFSIDGTAMTPYDRCLLSYWPML
jgi:hypothetical protein